MAFPEIEQIVHSVRVPCRGEHDGMSRNDVNRTADVFKSRGAQTPGLRGTIQRRSARGARDTGWFLSVAGTKPPACGGHTVVPRRQSRILPGPTARGPQVLIIGPTETIEPLDCLAADPHRLHLPLLSWRSGFVAIIDHTSQCVSSPDSDGVRYTG